MANITLGQVKGTLQSFASILQSQSEHLERLSQENSYLRGRLEAVVWDHRYNKQFETEFDATLFYNLMHQKVDPEWEPVKQIPDHLKTKQKWGPAPEQQGVHEQYEDEA